MTPTISDEAVQAAEEAVYARHERGFLMKPLVDPIDMRSALTAALPFLQGVKPGDLVNEAEILASDMPHTVVKKLDAAYEARILSSVETVIPVSVSSYAKIEAARKAVEELANTQMNLSIDDWSRISAAILSAIEVAPSPRAQALEEAATTANDISGLIDQYAKAAFDQQGKGVPRYVWDAHFREFATALAALSSQLVADGWLPIESAPKDTVVLMTWNYQGNWEYEAGIYGSTRGGWLHGQATHWRPLPASPEVAG